MQTSLSLKFTKMKKLIVLICLFTASTVFTYAQEKVTFRYNPTVGEKISYLSTMHMDVEADQSIIMDMTMKMFQNTTEKDANNVYSVVSQIESIKVDMNMGMMMVSYDSEDPDDSNPVAQQMGEQFSSFLNKDINLKIDEKAEVVDISDLEGFAGIGDLKSMFSTATFPEQAVAEGESWDMSITNEQLGMDVKYILTYVGKENGLIRVNVESNPDSEVEGAASITVAGYNLYDPATFVVIKSDITSTIEAPGATVINKAIMEKQ